MVRLGVRVSTGGSEESPEIVARRTAMETNHSGEQVDVEQRTRKNNGNI